MGIPATCGHGFINGASAWDGQLWAEAGSFYTAHGVAPPPQTVYLYLKFRGSDGQECYTPAR
jgi:hypothetical protein